MYYIYTFDTTNIFLKHIIGHGGDNYAAEIKQITQRLLVAGRPMAADAADCITSNELGILYADF